MGCVSLLLKLVPRSQKQVLISQKKAWISESFPPKSWGRADLWQFPVPCYIPSSLLLYWASYEGVFPLGNEHQIHGGVHWTLPLFFDRIVFCSFLSISHSLLHSPVSTDGHHTAHFVHMINILHLSSSQPLMKMLNNSKPILTPVGPHRTLSSN